MSTDRELLEYAAKAAGYEVAGLADDGESLLLVGHQYPWNPRKDDGDALRLAVKLRIDLRNFHPSEVAAQFKLRDQPGWHEHSEDWGADPYAATRHAIVRAAAEIGMAMGPGQKGEA